MTSAEVTSAEKQRAVEEVFRTLMEERGTPVSSIDLGRPLYDGGYGLDSMDTATLSAMLSERFESDPYLEGQLPQTIAQIVAFYTQVDGA